MINSLFKGTMRPVCMLMAGALLFACSKTDTGESKPHQPVIEVSEAQGITLTAEAGTAQLHYTVANATEEREVTELQSAII